MNIAYRRETIINVDESLCIACGNCIRTCPGGLITKGDRVPVPAANSWDLCIDCGHCVTVCPTGAMHQRAMDPDECAPLDIQLELFTNEAGQDQISRGAPCFIQAWAPKDERTAPQATTIAFAYAQLAAHALSLGSSWSGSINTAAQAHPPLIRLLGLPKGTLSFGTILLGYPAETFLRIPVRKAPDVTWL